MPRRGAGGSRHGQVGDIASMRYTVPGLADPPRPRGFQPGYEKRLSRPALAIVYAGFAPGLAADAALSRRGQSRAGAENVAPLSMRR